MVGAIAGLILAQKTRCVQRVYGMGSAEAESKKVNRSVLGKIIVWWVLNLPIVTLANLLITWIIYLCW